MSGLSSTVMSHFLEPRHAGTLPEPDGEGLAGSLESARFMRIQVCVRDGCIAAARFGTTGCAPAIAAGDYLCADVEGRTVDEARRWDAARLIEALGGLPEHRHYCATLAVEALTMAIEDAARRRAS